MFRIALILEENRELEFCKEILIKYAVQYDLEMDIRIYKNLGACMEELPDIDMAIINYEYYLRKETMKGKLNPKNEFCGICFYKKQLDQEGYIFEDRPVAYIKLSEFDTYVYSIISLLEREIKKHNNVLQLNTRFGCYAISKNDILYCQSDLKYVVVYTATKKVYKKVMKLSELEGLLGSEAFLRVHQSFLVNRDYVEELDKSRGILILRGGIEIPVSKNYAKDTVNSF
ncbi:MAG TPA: LytTR family transcriptional regulator [Clostridiales bacterium]|nr:LytTR family transcriptional regulator [Clostridiales bacterium]